MSENFVDSALNPLRDKLYLSAILHSVLEPWSRPGHTATPCIIYCLPSLTEHEGFVRRQDVGKNKYRSPGGSIVWQMRKNVGKAFPMQAFLESRRLSELSDWGRQKKYVFELTEKPGAIDEHIRILYFSK